MQTTLLGLAIAIILALVSALLAPFVIDWSHYRSTFEAEASRLTGLTVRVNGAIDARILPTPHLKLRDVEIGEAGRAPLARAASIELEVGLGPLLRGKVRATELRLVAPQINLGLDKSGAVDWPALSSSFRPEALAISRFDVEDGRVTLTDARSGARLVLRKLSFNGDIDSFVGPLSGAGVFVAGGEPYSYRISGSRGDEDRGFKLRLAVDPSNHPLTTAVEGTLSFDGGLPQFDGVLSLARPAGAALAGGRRVMSDPWQLAGRIHATAAAASLKDLALQYGPDERAVNFSGKAQVTFGAHPHLDGSISAVQVDVDRMLANPDETHRLPFVMLKSFLGAFVAAVKPPLPSKVDVAIAAMTVGGTTIQSLRGHVGFDAGRWRLDDVAFRAPGFTELKLSGKLEADLKDLSFSGPVSVESGDVKTLMAWLEGRGEQQPSGPAETLIARGDVTVASDRLALDRLSAVLDQEGVTGRLDYTWAAGKHPAALEGELQAATLDVDALAAFATAAAADAAFQMPRKIALVLDVGKATLAGVEARQVNARIMLDAGILHIDRLSVGDLAGAMIAVSGHIDELSSRPRGRLTLDVDATTLAGLTAVLGKFAPPVAASLRPFVDRLVPVKMHGVLTVDRASAGALAKLDLGGDLGAMRVVLNGEATGNPAHPAAAVVHIKSRFDADDGGAIARLLDLDHVLAVDQLPGQLTLSADGPLTGDIKISGLAAAGGFSTAVAGVLQLTGQEAPAGSLQVRMSAADLRPLHQALTGQPGAAVPMLASAIVGIAGRDLTLTDVAMTVGKSSLRGRLDLKLASPLGIDGTIEVNDIDAAAAAALLLGLPSAAPGDTKPWSPAPFGAGAFAALNGDLSVKLDRAVLTPSLVAHDLKGTVQFGPSKIALRDINASLAGGRLSGELDFRRDAGKLAAQGHVALSDADAATIIAGNNAVSGVLTVKLQGDGIGLSPDALVGSFHGSGTLAIAKAQFAGVDPAAFDAAVRIADQSGVVEAAKIDAVVRSVMDRGRFIAPQASAEVTVAGGQIYLTNVILHGQAGATLALDGDLDLNKDTLAARMTLSGQPAPNALIGARPELGIRVNGPLAAPSRQLDVASLVGWLTLRATEQQTRRLESVEANRRPDVLGQFIRPASPSLRFIPGGTPLEMTNRFDGAASVIGARAYDRLIPPPTPVAIKPPVPRAAVGADRTTATAAPAQPAPPPVLRSPLDLLFRSQN